GGATALASYALQGVAPLLKLLHLAEVRDSSARPLHAERTAKLLLVQRLVETAALLGDLPSAPTPEERAKLAALAAECQRFAVAVAGAVRFLPALPPGWESGAPSALGRVVAQL